MPLATYRTSPIAPTEELTDDTEHPGSAEAAGKLPGLNRATHKHRCPFPWATHQDLSLLALILSRTRAGEPTMRMRIQGFLGYTHTHTNLDVIHNYVTHT